MQKFLGTLLLVLILSVCSVFAQRPWQFSYPHKGQADSRVAKTTNSLYLFSDNTLSSYNHGLIWNDVLTLPGDVKGVTEVLNTVTIAVSQPTSSDPLVSIRKMEPCGRPSIPFHPMVTLPPAFHRIKTITTSVQTAQRFTSVARKPPSFLFQMTPRQVSII